MRPSHNTAGHANAGKYALSQKTGSDSSGQTEPLISKFEVSEVVLELSQELITSNKSDCKSSGSLL